MKPTNRCRLEGTNPRPISHEGGARNLGRLIALALCCVALLWMPGCKYTDVIREIIYIQDAEIEDTTTDQRVYVYDPDSDITSDLVPETTLVEDAEDAERTQPRAAYSSEAGEDYVAAQFVYDELAQYDTEASGTVTFVPQPDAVEEHNEEPEMEPEAEEVGDVGTEEQEDQSDQGGGGQEQDTDQDVAGSNVSPDASNPDEQGAEVGGGEGGEETIDYPSESGPGGLMPTVRDTRSEFEPIPEYDRVAAFGPAAQVVVLVAGVEPLVAADADFLSGGISNVFADRLASSPVALAWNGDGSSADQVDIDALIAAQPDAVLVYSESYFSDDQADKLAEAGIELAVIARMRNVAGIANDAVVIGQMLNGSKDLAEGYQPAARAQDWVEWHDRLIAEIEQANGGHTAAYNSLSRYQSDEEGMIVFDSTVNMEGRSFADWTQARYTLLIDAWDYDATYIGSYNGFTPVSPGGVGLSTVGYAWSPVSYYLGVGGAVNNAAADTTWTAKQMSHKAVVWQFPFDALPSVTRNAKEGVAVTWDYDSSGSVSEEEIPPDEEDTSGQSPEAEDASGDADEVAQASSSSEKRQDDVVVTISGSPLNDAITFTADGGRQQLLRMQGSFYVGQSPLEAEGFASARFPALIVTTQKMKTAFAANGVADGIYHAYGQSGGTPSTVGRLCGGLLLKAAIGQYNGGSETQVAGLDLSDRVLVNPRGLFCSWVDGSTESVLEGAWIASLDAFVPENGLGQDWLREVLADFYERFYGGYQLTDDDFATILAGKVE